MTATVSNTLNAVIDVVTITNIVVGPSSGHVIVRKRSSGLAQPSTSAASYRSLGIAVRPARNSTMLKPTSCHTPITASVGSTSAGSDRNASRGTPSAPRKAFTGPSFGCSRKVHTNAIAISVDVTG